MQPLLFFALAATVLGAAIPEANDPVRTLSFGGPGITRSVVLPPLPIETGGISIWKDKKREALDAEAREIAEEHALKRRETENFGTVPPTGQVTITAMTYGGTGCPNYSVGSAISSDQTTMTLIFDDYVASIGPGVAITESRKNCQLNLNLKYPGGFQYSVFSADYRGYAYLDKGISGAQKSIYYFSGQTAQASTGTTWVGPYTGNYLISDQAQSASLIYSPCGANAMLNINSAISLTSTNSTGQGLLTDDSIDTKFTQVIYIQWQACKS